mgnify:CR=1 FL=1
MKLPPRFKNFPTSEPVIIDMKSHWITGFYNHRDVVWMYYDPSGYYFQLEDEEVQKIVGWSSLKDKTDPRHWGIPNINFSYDDDNPSESIEYINQRLERGFDDGEVDELSYTILRFIIPRLEAHLERSIKCESYMDFKGVPQPQPKVVHLKEVLEVFKKIVNEEEIELSTAQEAINKFAENFFTLWI